MYFIFIIISFDNINWNYQQPPPPPLYIFLVKKETVLTGVSDGSVCCQWRFCLLFVTTDGSVCCHWRFGLLSSYQWHFHLLSVTVLYVASDNWRFRLLSVKIVLSCQWQFCLVSDSSVCCLWRFCLLSMTVLSVVCDDSAWYQWRFGSVCYLWRFHLLSVTFCLLSITVRFFPSDSPMSVLSVLNDPP